MIKIEGQARDLLLGILSEPELIVSITKEQIMSRFKVTTYSDYEYDSEGNKSLKPFDWYLVEAINPEDLNHDCLGHYEGIWGGKEDLVQHLNKVYYVNESELHFIKKVEKEDMTIQWKKLVNFDVPQKLWDIADIVAKEKGWTTEAVLCDAAEKYLGYIEEDPDNEMISIQIPKSLYDRIEAVGNKSVEREIEREMTEWVELVEDIYEDSEEEETENYYKELESEKKRFNVFPYFNTPYPHWISVALKREDSDSEFVGRFENNTSKDAILAFAQQFDIAEDEINFIWD